MDTGHAPHTQRFNLLLLAALAFLLLIPAPGRAERFSIVFMPDPQYYTTSNHPALYDFYRRQTRWIRDNAAEYNIKHVVWLGDLTNDNTNTQWNVAHQAYSILDTAQIPYTVVPGNHDYKPASGWPGAHYRDLTRYNNIVGPGRFHTKSWYGGNMGETLTNNENNYAYLTVGDLDFLIVGLEYGPRKEVLTWANDLISQHPNHRVIIATHGYMTTNGNYGAYAGSSTGWVGASGREIFDELASRHSNVFMVACGHVTESVINTKTGVAGNIIYEMLVDYQSEKPLGQGANLGNGWLRIMEFDTDTNRIYGSTVTPAEGDTAIFHHGVPQFYFTSRYSANPGASDHLFALNYNMSDSEPYVYMNASSGFHALSMGDDLYGDQQDVVVAQADNGDFVGAWEDDHDANGIYTIAIRGFDYDGNERFPKTIINTTSPNSVNATNPSIAMAPDGRFVVTWQNGSREIRMRSFNADGTPIAPTDVAVQSVTAPGSVNNPDVAIDDLGNFVITWADDNDGNGVFQIYARGFVFNGAQRFGTKTVNAISSGQQVRPAIAMRPNGDYIVTWDDNKDGSWDIYMRGYFADEMEWIPQARVNTTVTSAQANSDVAVDNTGQFVVVWEDDSNVSAGYEVRARGFNAIGGELFSERSIHAGTSGNQINPSVSMDFQGQWYASWQDNGVGGEGYQIMANVFNTLGNRLAGDSQINHVASVTHKMGTPLRKTPVVDVHKSGRYLVAWADDMDGDGKFQPLVRGVSGLSRSLSIKAINGSVEKSPDEPLYFFNSEVTLTAVPDPGYSFVRWTGHVPTVDATKNPVTIMMNSNKRVTAEFEESSTIDGWELY